MSNIIEKLGIKPIPCRDFGSGDFVFPKNKVRELEQQRDEMLKNQIENLICLENIYENTNLGIYGMVIRSRIDNTKHAIEKATGKPWSKIKELHNA